MAARTKETLEAIAMFSNVLDYNQTTGQFIWTSCKPQRNDRVGCVAGSDNGRGYIRIRVEHMIVMAHRLAWAVTNGSWPTGQIDHIDGNKSNNRISNLRDVDQSTNQHNRISARKDNKRTCLLGIQPHKNQWRVNIMHNKKNKHIGLFDTIEEAQSVYFDIKKKYGLLMPTNTPVAQQPPTHSGYLGKDHHETNPRIRP